MESLFADGASLYGKRVVKIRAVLEDGRVVEVDLPSPGVVEVAETRYSPSEMRILDLFASFEPNDRIKGTVVASLLKVKPGTVKKSLSHLVNCGALTSDAREGGYGRGPRYPEELRDSDNDSAD